MESWPLGNSRRAVRGLRASMRMSTSRLSPIANERAPTIASVIQSRSCADGVPATARNAPTYANGSAKTVCSIFTSRAKRAGNGASVDAEALTPPCYAVSGNAPSRLRHQLLVSDTGRCLLWSVALLVRDVHGAAEELQGMRQHRAQDFVAVADAA